MNPRKLKPEEKVNLAINMTDVCVQICANGIRDQNKNITEAQLLKNFEQESCTKSADVTRFRN